MKKRKYGRVTWWLGFGCAAVAGYAVWEGDLLRNRPAPVEEVADGEMVASYFASARPYKPEGGETFVPALPDMPPPVRRAVSERLRDGDREMLADLATLLLRLDDYVYTIRITTIHYPFGGDAGRLFAEGCRNMGLWRRAESWGDGDEILLGSVADWIREEGSTFFMSERLREALERPRPTRLFRPVEAAVGRMERERPWTRGMTSFAKYSTWVGTSRTDRPYY